MSEPNPESEWTPRRQFYNGVRAILPVQLGVLPFAIICGVTAVNSGLTPWVGQGFSLILFAGASQLVAIQLIASDTPAAIVVLSAFIVNLRFVMYSASLATHFKALPWRWKLPLAHMVTDQGYAVAIAHFNDHPEEQNKHWYFGGAGIFMWTVWQLGTLIGVLIGQDIPESWSLEFAVPLTFLAIVMPSLKDNAAIAALVSSGAVAVTGIGLPLNLGLIAAALTGISVGMFLEARTA